jgi:hypothetical protein
MRGHIVGSAFFLPHLPFVYGNLTTCCRPKKRKLVLPFCVRFVHRLCYRDTTNAANRAGGTKAARMQVL